MSQPQNPLLDLSGPPRFDAIQPEHVESAIRQRIEEVEALVEELVQEDRPRTWQGFVEPLDAAEEALERAWGPVEHLNGVMNSEELREAYNATKPLLAEFSARISQDERLQQATQQVMDREGETLDPVERRSTFDEVHLGIEDTSEAERCLSCGVCNECDLCITYCPEGVLKRVGHSLEFDYGYCKGCGMCVAECPRNVIFMSHL